jgi:glycosyltransferase involved in cell wall biosynthesis
MGEVYDLTILTYGNPKLAPKLHNTNLIIVPKNLGMVRRLFRYTLKLLEISKNFDLIYVQNAVASGFPVAINKLVRGTPYILKFVGDEAWERATQKGETKKLLEDFHQTKKSEHLSLWVKTLTHIQRFTLKNANLVTAPSDFLSNMLIENYGLDKSKVLTNYNASENEEILQIENVKKKEFQICVTARLTKWKGVEGILEAVQILKPKFPDLTCVIAGDGPELEHLKSYSEKLGLTEFVKFLGRVSREETYKLRKESSVYVLNSTYEGLPHTVLSSFHAQIPVVATDIGGTNEAVYDGVSGILVPINNPERLAEAILKLLSDKDLQRSLVEGGTKILNEKFSWSAHIKKLEGFFRQVTSG